MSTRRTTKQAPRNSSKSGLTPPPAPATEWGDEEEFKQFWGKGLDEIVEEFRHEDEAVPPRPALSADQFLASLEERQ